MTSSECRCCIVGGGPAGLVLGLLLSRRGIPTTLLEAHDDFDRAFRGDTVHPSTLEMLDDLGLAQACLEIDHAKMQRMVLQSGGEETAIADFSRLRVKFPYIAMIPQVHLLELLADEAAKYPAFDLRLGCRAKELLIEEGRVCGVAYERDGEREELRATLTVAADGRGSRMRKRAGFERVKNAAAMDVMWIVLPRDEGEEIEAGFRIGLGRLVVVLARQDEWQLGYVILKGDARTVRDQGLEVLRDSIRLLVPELGDRVDSIQNWKQAHHLSVESSRIPTWHRDGFLAIGDAAHVMSPIGGVGINYAIQDAVATANLLADPLLGGTLTEADLARVQARRELPVRWIQRFQGLIQRVMVKRALDDRPFRLPLPVRVLTALPVLRDIPARIIGWGLRPERVAGGGSVQDA
ncbi:MAG: FAD-binding protein [Acidobacteria bacterium]|nr:FAD-binding protein [Acidobacteriota bacterium]